VSPLALTEAAPQETTLEAGGHAKGVAVAVVKENKDSSGQGRVKVSFPWHSQPQQSYWARIATPMAGKQRGIYFLPEVNDEVLVAFDRGDLRFPYVLGSLWNGQDQSPESNADGKNDVRVIHSRSHHKITINDGAQPLIQIELADGKRVTLDQNGIELSDKGGSNKVTMQMTAGTITVQAAASISLKAPQISIEASGTMTVKSGGTLTVQGSLVTIN
jgi:uncharacterized protein involved in type VI secretion and phage assembly